MNARFHAIFVVLIALCSLSCKSTVSGPVAQINLASGYGPGISGTLKPGQIVRVVIEGTGLEDMKYGAVKVGEGLSSFTIGDLRYVNGTVSSVFRVPEFGRFPEGEVQLELAGSSSYVFLFPQHYFDSIESNPSQDSASHAQYGGDEVFYLFNAPTVSGLGLDEDAPAINRFSFDRVDETHGRIKLTIAEKGVLSSISTTLRTRYGGQEKGSDGEVVAEREIELFGSSDAAESLCKPAGTGIYRCTKVIELPAVVPGRPELEIIVTDIAEHSTLYTAGAASKKKFEWPTRTPDARDLAELVLKNFELIAAPKGLVKYRFRNESPVELRSATLTIMAHRSASSVESRAVECKQGDCQIEFLLPQLKKHERFEYRMSVVGQNGASAFVEDIKAPPADQLDFGHSRPRLSAVNFHSANSAEFREWQQSK